MFHVKIYCLSLVLASVTLSLSSYVVDKALDYRPVVIIENPTDKEVCLLNQRLLENDLLFVRVWYEEEELAHTCDVDYYEPWQGDQICARVFPRGKIAAVLNLHECFQLTRPGNYKMMIKEPPPSLEPIDIKPKLMSTQDWDGKDTDYQRGPYNTDQLRLKNSDFYHFKITTANIPPDSKKEHGRTYHYEGPDDSYSDLEDEVQDL